MSISCVNMMHISLFAGRPAPMSLGVTEATEGGTEERGRRLGFTGVLPFEMNQN